MAERLRQALPRCFEDEDIPDLEAVESNFDQITYAKGGSVLVQLVGYLGRETFLAGLRTSHHRPRDFARRAVIVTDVETAREAFRDAGVRVGHLVTELNGQPVTDLGTRLSQFFTLLYFAFFLLMPWFSRMDATRPPPARLTH